MSNATPLLLTGATGYVGGRLLRTLKAQKISVRCPKRLDIASLKRGLAGVDTAIYLVHSPDAHADSEEAEYQSAMHFAHACAVNKVRKIIYLGRLGNSSHASSPSLRYRQKVGEILWASGVPVVEFRTSTILGSGSMSFEILRALVERLPVMVTPRWVNTLSQPIAVDDVTAYLMEAIDYRGRSRVFEIGGPEQVPYRELMNEYARQRKLRRWKVSVPGILPRLSRRWLDFVAPQYGKVSASVMADLCVPSVVTHPQALRVFRVRPRSYPEAIAEALRN